MVRSTKISGFQDQPSNDNSLTEPELGSAHPLSIYLIFLTNDEQKVSKLMNGRNPENYFTETLMNCYSKLKYDIEMALKVKL